MEPGELKVAKTQQDVRDMLALLSINPLARYAPGAVSRRMQFVDVLRYYRMTGKTPSPNGVKDQTILLEFGKWLHGFESELDKYTEA